MNKSKFGVIFDCDGTLANSLGLGMGSYNYALEKIGEPPREPDVIKKFFGAGADRIFQRLLNHDEKALLAFNYYLEHEEKHISRVHLHQGIPELLTLLKQKGVPLGVVTGRHLSDLDFIFKHHSLHHYFEAIVCDNHLPKSKPAPDGILMAAAQMNLHPTETFYVGDSTMDMVAAHAAGSKPIAALWDEWVKPMEMEREKPVLMAKTPETIADFLKLS